ncbi:MAG: protein-disulfide isomerase, partial [Leptospiraceae bacterium]|nr:protein-disulfide isomerase [Leptospiraceae bacterium]
MKTTKLLYIMIGLGIVGLILSYLLAIEFYGSSELASSLCSALGSEDSCTTVKNSSFSSFSLPWLGDVPIALLGFSFYGLATALAYLSTKEEKPHQHISILFVLSVVALLIDI